MTISGDARVNCTIGTGRCVPDSPSYSGFADVLKQSINSIDRGLLNIGLLDELSSYNNIRIHFRSKLTTVDFNSRVATFATQDGSFDVRFDLCVGADGSYSNVRRQMMRVVRYVSASLCGNFC
jgi:2-polyprenyl-6-methoxyphenol hydroxylase-like FAD-dependent oxidoreductase